MRGGPAIRMPVGAGRGARASATIAAAWEEAVDGVGAADSRDLGQEHRRGQQAGATWDMIACLVEQTRALAEQVARLAEATSRPARPTRAKAAEASPRDGVGSARRAGPGGGP